VPADAGAVAVHASGAMAFVPAEAGAVAVRASGGLAFVPAEPLSTFHDDTLCGPVMMINRVGYRANGSSADTWS
jgi:hypothetical protein